MHTVYACQQYPLCMYVRTLVQYTRIYTHVMFPVHTLLLLDEGGQQTAVNGAGGGGLHSPKKVSPGTRGSITLPSNGRGTRLSPPRTTQVETHGTPMTDPLPRAVTVGSHATAHYVNGQVEGTSPSSHESSVSLVTQIFLMLLLLHWSESAASCSART